jgi:hypothetical protein
MTCSASVFCGSASPHCAFRSVTLAHVINDEAMASALLPNSLSQLANLRDTVY